jgi:hypothetical protein
MRIAEYHEYRPGWYRGGPVAALVLEYCGLLRSILRARPHLRRCLTRCRHCRIFFITHACNAGRPDLGCPFGCQRTYRRRESTKRSTAYYCDEAGKMKKKIQNGQRAAEKTAEAAAPAEPSEAMIKHLQRVLSAIEGRKVSREEVLALRQRSLVEEGRAGDNAAQSNERPP